MKAYIILFGNKVFGTIPDDYKTQSSNVVLFTSTAGVEQHVTFSEINVIESLPDMSTLKPLNDLDDFDSPVNPRKGLGDY